jgi:hypothetical protein
MFNSRAFTSQVLDATEAADMARHNKTIPKNAPYDHIKLFADRFAVLLPLLDLPNHRPGAKMEWEARYHNFVGLKVLEPYEPDQEICNNYGPRDNEALLLAYGFVIVNNPFDHLVVALKLPPGSPVDQARRMWKLDFRSDPERRCFIFCHRHPESTGAICLESSLFSFDLLDSISILLANEREMQSMSARSQSMMSYCLNHTAKFEDDRIVLATLAQLLRDCSNRAERLKSTDPSSTGLEPTNNKQRNAKIYRDSQLEIVVTAAAVCQFVLRYAYVGAKDDTELLNSLEGQVDPVALTNLTSLLGRHVRLTHPEELMDINGLIEMLPKAEDLRQCLTLLRRHLSSQASNGTYDGSTPDRQKAHLAVVMSALYSEYVHGVKLPHRSTEWLKQLAAWYPFDAQSWAYVPTKGPWATGEEPPQGLVSLLAAQAAMLSEADGVKSPLKRWLRPERLCWGWNVIEEEKVIVPNSIKAGTQSHNGTDDDSLVLIYWQQC